MAHFRLPAEFYPEAITEQTRIAFTQEIHHLLNGSHLAHLPAKMVQKQIGSYYQQFPVQETDRVHEEQKLNLQNDKLRVVSGHTLQWPETTAAWNLAVAFRARKLHHATASMYALLTAYGMTIEQLPSKRSTTRGY